MENTLSVAKVFYDEYLKRYGVTMDEMKMHKLMYFIQRESLMETGELLFDEPFYGWKFGPVLKNVRIEYREVSPFAKVNAYVSPEGRELVAKVFDRYASMPSWKLSSLSHAELSWKRSRRGLSPSENGDVQLELSAMKVDATREKFERKYYDD